MQQRTRSPGDLEVNSLAVLLVSLLAGVTALSACGAPAAPTGQRSAIVERAQGSQGCATPIRVLGSEPQLTAHFTARSSRCTPQGPRPAAAAAVAVRERDLEPLAAGTTDLATPLEADHVSLIDDSYGVLGP